MTVRALLAEDSPLAVALLTEVLTADGDIEVVGVARDGAEAVRLNRELRPEIVLLDLDLPVLDGLSALDRMLAERPVPVLVVTGTPRGPGASTALDALRRGALDLLVKPHAWSAAEAETLRTRVRTLARVRVAPSPPRRPPTNRPSRGARAIVGIGCSTGGPPALAEILGALPGDFETPIVVVQHIQADFDRTLASWLDGCVPLPVRLAERGAPVGPGVWIAPAGLHTRLGADLRFVADAGPLRDGHRPSATVLFESLAEQVGSLGLGVVLTGLGEDGATGLAALRDAGGHTVAESEATAVVYGMPRAAAQRGAARTILPRDRIAQEIRAWARR